MVDIKFEFEYRDTPFHNMHPIVNGLVFVFLASLATIWFDLFFLAVLLVLSVIIVRISQTPKEWIMPVLSVRLFAFFLGTFTNPHWVFMANPDFFKKLPIEFISREILQITPVGFPLFGYTAITYGSLYFRLAQVLKSLIVFMLTFTLVWTLNPSDLFQYFVSLGLPNQVTVPLMVAFRFSPIMSRHIANIWNAQTLRGRHITKERKVTRFVEQTRAFAYPLGRRFVEAVDLTTISTVNRGFGLKRMSPRRPLGLGASDRLTILGLPLLFALLYYLCTSPPWYLGNI